jgi:hypothetical protein
MDLYKLKNGDFFSMKNATINYCKNDVFLLNTILTQIALLLNKEFKNILRNCFSLPSVSNKIFFGKYNNYKIKKNLDLSHDQFLRSSYYGGRCEVFGNIMDGQIIKYFDFSGMYAQCMLENFHTTNGSFTNNKDIRKPGFHTIIYKSNLEIPVLPQHLNNKLMFINGTLEGTF